MNAEDVKTIEAMRKYGGSFEKALARMAAVSDDENLKKLKEAWAEEWGKYRACAARAEHRGHNEPFLQETTGWF